MISDLTALGLELSPDLGPVTPGNGELGILGSHERYKIFGQCQT